MGAVDYRSEADLCSGFIKWAETRGWKCYPETGGFDIVVVAPDGRQIGVEAKLRLNAKVILQCAERYHDQGPDYRAVLVPKISDLAEVCRILGITVLRPASYPKGEFSPDLPPLDTQWWHDRGWFENLPSRRLTLPEYVPDVQAGVKSPLQLTTWKIKMIRLSIILDRGPVTNAVFKSLGLNKYNLKASGYVAPTPEGMVKANFPDLRAQHPTNYAEIEKDIEKWIPKQSVS